MKRHTNTGVRQCSESVVVGSDGVRHPARSAARTDQYRPHIHQNLLHCALIPRKLLLISLNHHHQRSECLRPDATTPHGEFQLLRSGSHGRLQARARMIEIKLRIDSVKTPDAPAQRKLSSFLHPSRTTNRRKIARTAVMKYQSLVHLRSKFVGV